MAKQSKQIDNQNVLHSLTGIVNRGYSLITQIPNLVKRILAITPNVNQVEPFAHSSSGICLNYYDKFSVEIECRELINLLELYSFLAFLTLPSKQYCVNLRLFYFPVVVIVNIACVVASRACS